MARLPDEYLDFVLYLYDSAKAARRGRRKGGTGFLVIRPPRGAEERGSLFAVTNAHVISQGNSIVALNKSGGGRGVIELRQADWILHRNGDDLAVARIEWSDEFQFHAMPMDDWFLTPRRMELLNIGAGDEVVIPGRFISHAGGEENLPIARFGRVARMQTDPVWSHLTKRYQESHLVEAHSSAGFSGSPVLVYIPPGDTRLESAEDAGEAAYYLLGVAYGHFRRERAGVVTVVPVAKLHELIDSL